MTAIHLPHQRPAPGPASADAAPAGEPAWSRVLVVAGSRAALAAVLSLVVWAVLPAALGWSPRVIMSGSMLPRIEVGDVVVDRPVDPASLTEGRIITVTDPDHPEKTRTHRFQELDDQGRLVTKGDANDAADSTPVDPGDVLGVAVLRVPYVGLPMTWMAQGQLAPVGVAVTVLLLLGLAATAPLRLAPQSEDDRDEEDDTHGPGGPGGDASRTRADAGLDILVAGASAAELADASRRGGGSVARSASPTRLLPRRLLSGFGVALGAVLAVALTTQSTYAAMSAQATNPTSSFSSAAVFGTTAYLTAVGADNPLLFWRMDETSGATVADSAVGAADPGTLRGGYVRGRSGALESQPASRALGLSGGSLVGDDVTMSLGTRFTVEAWVRTTSTQGGLVVGLGNQGGVLAPTQVDRVLYLSPDGTLRLGVSGQNVASSTTRLNDGAWHHVVGTLGGNGNGQLDATVYVDGVPQGTGKGRTLLAMGWWRVGAGDLSGFANAPTSAALVADVDEVAVYTSALSSVRVKAHYDASR